MIWLDLASSREEDIPLNKLSIQSRAITMSRVHDHIKAEILRGEKNLFIFQLSITIIGYIGMTFWLNSIRQTAPIWVVWVLIVIQFLFLITFFAVCSVRAKQCGFRHAWLIFIVFILSRVSNWEFVLLPLLVLVMLILSERNQNVSAQRQHLLPDESGSSETE